MHCSWRHALSKTFPAKGKEALRLTTKRLSRLLAIARRDLFVFGNVFASKVAKRYARHTIVGAFYHEGVCSAKYVAYHGPDVVKTRNCTIVGIANLHMDIGIQTAQYREKAECITHLRKKSPFSMACM